MADLKNFDSSSSSTSDSFLSHRPLLVLVLQSGFPLPVLEEIPELFLWKPESVKKREPRRYGETEREKERPGKKVGEVPPPTTNPQEFLLFFTSWAPLDHTHTHHFGLIVSLIKVNNFN